MLELLFPSEIGASHWVSVEQALSRSSHDQQTQNFPLTPTSEPCIDLMDLPIPINIICCSRMTEEITTGGPDPSTNHTRALKPLLIYLGLLFVISSLPV